MFMGFCCFFFKQKTAYEMRISDWSSDVCSSDLKTVALETATFGITANCISPGYVWTPLVENQIPDTMKARNMTREQVMNDVLLAGQPTKQFVTVEQVAAMAVFLCRNEASNITGANISVDGGRSEEHTSELQSLMRISYAVFCLKKKNKHSTTS